ncbi:MAG: HlyD family efflux transporter periplasmic adaptor subunit [Clostridiaceae bacterium]|jgi:HlyD family secretion protein|nr:HlyD family efflux transporter periplasmic adaptor subunit [Clostridiaceae bacterium]
MKKKRRIITVIIIAVILILTVVIVNSQNKEKPFPVRVTEATKGDIETVLSINALIESKHTKEYMGKAQYTVETVHVKVGDKVKAGDVLLSYDIKDYENAVIQAQIQYENALLNKAELLEQKKNIEDEIQELDEKIFILDGSSDPEDIANLQALIQARKSIQEISDEKIMLMDNSIALAKLQLDTYTDTLNEAMKGIVAEFEGVVTQVNATESLPLSMAQPAFVVQQLDNLKGVINLGKYDAAKIQTGQKVTLKYESYTYEGRVSFIEPVASKDMAMGSADATIQAEIDILNPDEHLKINFDVNADILIASAKQVLMLPTECLKYGKDGDTSVFIVKDGMAVLTPVTIGIQSDTEVEIKNGLSEGDVVISTPPENITDGAAVILAGDMK